MRTPRCLLRRLLRAPALAVLLVTASAHDEAAAEFDKSYAIVSSPNALFFLARCDRERGKLVTAYAELGRTAAEAREHASEDTRYVKTAQAASDERDAIA